ncbi:MAG: hypothetical protein M1820_009596 [Bogoriella megaspora]|nr:MAG: hypothetical protein M1820_009596 [Bogoriella megaspora]
MPAHTGNLQAQSILDEDDEDLTPEQMHVILKEAEIRIREKNALTQASKPSFKGLPKLSTGPVEKPYIHNDGAVARVDQSRLLAEDQRKLANRARQVEDPVIVKQRATKKKKGTAGSDWFNLPKTDLTPELKRDLQMLKMRNVLDPHRHYKKENSKMLVPEYSQVGTIEEGPTEYFSARIPNKERRRNIVEEVLAREEEGGRFKSKFDDIQSAKRSGKKSFYKALKAQRKKKMRR